VQELGKCQSKILKLIRKDMNNISEKWQITLQYGRRLTLKNLSSSLAKISTHFRKAGSAMSAISEGAS
jgi:hypothetical protein